MANLKGGTTIDGALTVKKGTGTASQVPGAAGPAAVFESAASGTSTNSKIGICIVGSIDVSPSTQRFIMVYEDEGNSNRLTAVAGELLDMNISFGTPVPFGGTQTTGGRALDVRGGDSLGGTVRTFIVVYSDNSNSNYGTVIVGTVGTSYPVGGPGDPDNTITFGSPQVFSNNLAITEAKMVHSTGGLIIAYEASGGRARIATQSGTSFSFGTATSPISNAFTKMDAAYVANPASEKSSVVVYSDTNNSNYLTAMVATVSGTTITFGSPTVFYAVNTGNKPYIFYDSDPYSTSGTVVAWKNSSGAGRARVATITASNRTISFGTEAGFTSNNIDADFDIAQEYDFANAEAGAGPCFIHHDTTQGKIVATPATISGTTISFGTPAVGPTVDANKIVAIGDAYNEKIVCAYVDASNSNYGTGMVWRPYTAGGITVDLDTGSFFEVDFQGVSDIHSFTINNVDATPGHVSSFVLKITQGDNNPRRTRWRWDPLSAVFMWPGGNPGTNSKLSTTNDYVDIFEFTTYDNGTTWHSKILGQNVS